MQKLQRLLRSGLVESRREGTRIFYSLSSPVVGELWRAIRRAAQEHVAGLEQLATDYLGDRSKLHTISRDDLRARLCDGDMIVVDVLLRLSTQPGTSAARSRSRSPT